MDKINCKCDSVVVLRKIRHTRDGYEYGIVRMPNNMTEGIYAVAWMTNVPEQLCIDDTRVYLVQNKYGHFCAADAPEVQNYRKKQAQKLKKSPWFDEHGMSTAHAHAE